MNRFLLSFFLVVLGYALHAQQPVDVYLIGGQSNTTGQGLVANLPQSFVADKEVMLFYSKSINKGENSMKWMPLCPASMNTHRFGFELSLGNKLHHYYPASKIAIIKHALSGSNLYSQWNPGNVEGNVQGPEYQKFIKTVITGLTELKKQGYQPVIRAMFWQQGEADARELAGEVNNRAYGKNLNNFIHQVRKEVECENMLFVYGTVLPLAATRFPGRDLVKEAQRQIAENAHSALSVKNAILVEADDLQMLSTDYNTPFPKDDVHLGTFGLLNLGERFAKVVYEKQKQEQE
ncbi:MAG: sialate O-acetylesterase [Bacteroides sp.]